MPKYQRLCVSIVVMLAVWLCPPDCLASPWLWVTAANATSPVVIDLGRAARMSFLKDTSQADYVEIILLGSPSRIVSKDTNVITKARNYVSQSATDWVKLDGSAPAFMRKRAVLSIRLQCRTANDCVATLEVAQNGSTAAATDPNVIADLKQLVTGSDWVLAEQATQPAAESYLNIAFLRRATVTCPSQTNCSAEADVDGPLRLITTQAGVDRVKALTSK
jgi:hypothetical protein